VPLYQEYDIHLNMSFSLIFVQVGEKKALESDTKLIMTFNSLRVQDVAVNLSKIIGRIFFLSLTLDCYSAE